MTIAKMPLNTSLRWPKQFGFDIVGNGPCFVISVEKGSVAFSSGLQPGDQILELDDQDVTNMSAEALKTLAKHSRTVPPTLGVVSRILHVDIVGNKAMGLGFVVNDCWPVSVRTVEEGGPAHAVGMRRGDIIVEMNGRTVLSSGDIKPLLATHSKRIPMSYIPIGKYIVSPTKTANGPYASEGSRVKRAKDLHDKMNEILGDDYEKKMAVVGVLKQYAEDRDIDMLARALCVILKTPHQRKLLRQIRPFIPPRQRKRFDDIIRHQQQVMIKEKTPDKQQQQQQQHQQTNGSSPSTSHKMGKRRALQIVRENGSFGFVIKGSNPAYIETADPGGPADKAGLQPGDYVMKLNGIDVRKSSHAHLVSLLQDSGTAPIVEILRCDNNEFPGGSGTGSHSSRSSSSSHADSDWMTPEHKLITDKEGQTYHDKAEYLLTSKERSHIRKAMVEYDSTFNVVDLFESVSQVLDAPSKKTLWMFIIGRLSTQHQQYCTNQINLPRKVLMECVEKPSSSNNKNNKVKLKVWPSEAPGDNSSSTSGWASQSDSKKDSGSIKISSFQQQVEYLLTSRERSVLKKALQLYSENRNVEHLIEDLDVILDTPSKRTLWMYIIPLLSQDHQDMVRQRVASKAASDKAGTDQSGRKSKSKSGQQYMSSEDDEHELFSKSGARKSRSKHGQGTTAKSVDLALIKELEETRKVVQDAKHFFNNKGRDTEADRDQTRFVTVIPVDGQNRDPSMHSPVSLQLPAQPFQGFPGAVPIFTSPPTPMFTSFPSPQGPMLFHSPQGPMASYGAPQVPFIPGFSNPQGHMATSVNGPLGLVTTASNLLDDSSSNMSSLTVNNGIGPEVSSENRLKIPANFMTSGHESDEEAKSRKTSANVMVSKFSKMGGDTFNRHALTALKQLDAAVAAEVSDLENATDQSNSSSSQQDKDSPAKATGEVTLAVPPPVPPPPPPPPPPVAPPLPPMSGADKPGDDKAAQMNVKRINWQKLDQQGVENTIWEQIGEATDLQDVVKYLELEQYFSTKSTRPSESEDDKSPSSTCSSSDEEYFDTSEPDSAIDTFETLRLTEKKNEVCIINPKKSYNISILLGHLKLSLSEVRHALYLMDESILTPELLRQLLAYAPSRDEMERLDSYSGDVEELSKPDRFTFEMSRVPGYEQRLKALIFKGNFQEKITEMKEHLNCIRKASLELRLSKKLSKILELILAMGNYMNQGNQRVGEAAGFKIQFLSQLEITKTSDNKMTFLHVLAEAVHSKFPDMTAVGEELTTVPTAAKYSNVLLNQELQDLRKVLQDISNTLEKFGSQKTSLGINDKFQDVMGHFISQASDEIQSLFRLNANTMEEFHNTVSFFGEDAKKVTTNELFGVFGDFITKFEKAHRQNIVFNRYS